MLSGFSLGVQPQRAPVERSVGALSSSEEVEPALSLGHALDPRTPGWSVAL